MQEFWIRVVSTMMIIGILFGYNVKLSERKKDEEIAKLYAQIVNVQENQDSNVFDTMYMDGTYTGEADGFGGKISVEVLVQGGKITDVRILSAEGEDGAYLTMAKEIIPEIISKQVAEVDIISGATFSSNGIREATKIALEKAVQ